MKDLSRKFQIITLAAASFLSVTISLLGMFGLLAKNSWIIERIPLITLLLLSGLLAYAASGLSHRFEEVEDCLKELKSHANRQSIDNLAGLRSQMDKNLEIIFGDHFADLLSKIEQVLRKQTIELHDLDEFLFYYKSALEKYPRTTFYATSLPYSEYMWKSKGLEGRIHKFVEHGGKMVRVFFLDKMEELEDSSITRVLDRHCNIGSEVYVADSRRTPHGLSSYFVVESEGHISWEVIVNPRREIVKVIVSSNPAITDKYLKLFKKIVSLDSTRRYTVAHTELTGEQRAE